MSEAVLALIERRGRWLLQRRDPANAVLPGRWEFPGGKPEAGESPEAALLRELAEEVQLSPSCVRPLATFEGPIRLRAYRVWAEGEPRTELAWGWFTVAEARRLPLPPANAAILDRLAGPPEAI